MTASHRSTGRDTEAAPVVEDAPPRSPPRAAWCPVLLVAAVVAAVHVVAATRPGRWYDEALMLAIGRHHLDWGAVDQPPGVPLLARLAHALAPGSQLVLEAPAILATVSGVVLTALIARELGGDARAQTVAALAQATGQWAAFTGHWLTPYTIEPAQWLTVGLIVVRWIRTRDDRLLLALGVVVGLSAQTKVQILLLAAVLTVCVALIGPRALLRRPMLWVGAALALLIAAPTLIWQAQHGWPQAGLARYVAEQAANHGGRANVAVELLLLAGPLCLVLIGVGLFGLATRPELRDQRFLGLTFVVLYVLFVIPPGRPSYLAGFYGLLAAFGAVVLQRRRAAGRSRWWRLEWPATAVLLVASAVLALPMILQSITVASPVVADAVLETTARSYRSLPAEVRARTAVMTDTFMYAAYLDTAYPDHGLPLASSGSISYGYFPPPPESRDTVLLVGSGRGLSVSMDRLRPYFPDARLVDQVTPTSSRAVFGGGTPTQTWLLSGRRAPWETFWPELRSVWQRAG